MKKNKAEYVDREGGGVLYHVGWRAKAALEQRTGY